MVSDVDEIPRPSAVRALVANPPRTYVMLRAHFFYYSLRYEGETVWVRNGVVRYGAIDRELGWYRAAIGNVVPGFNAVHCSYCFGTVREIIRKLETFPHYEYSAGKYVDPHYIIARVACGLSLFEEKGGVFKVREKDLNELDLPRVAEFMGWRLPFTDLHTMNLNITKIRRLAKCRPDLVVIDGKLYGYQ
jgi:beta-1,4-mannosyl-glycoprotein beta-1,4-N-acetylglucosaminyltransferase